ncbi:hypothetical protein B0H16DRAFT_1465738 [Mycena metata]|uniref:Uncharacterized protein n=1 Tax=Mycena metata TaxID=1033252 RepID=A0AAD7MZA2_9AGAR|nr:hypothetical protein B0H16DRAFT_1465738 [Mycena metata]
MLDWLYVTLILCLIASNLTRLTSILQRLYAYFSRPRETQLIPYFDESGQLIGMVRVPAQQLYRETAPASSVASAPIPTTTEGDNSRGQGQPPHRAGTKGYPALFSIPTRMTANLATSARVASSNIHSGGGRAATVVRGVSVGAAPTIKGRHLAAGAALSPCPKLLMFGGRNYDPTSSSTLPQVSTSNCFMTSSSMPIMRHKAENARTPSSTTLGHLGDSKTLYQAVNGMFNFNSFKFPSW